MNNITNIKSFNDFIENCNLDKHYDCCKMIYITIEFKIDGENFNNIFCLSVSFSEFNDIENDFEIYEFAWEKFNLFIENIDFKEIYEQQKEKNYIRKLQEQN